MKLLIIFIIILLFVILYYLQRDQIENFNNMISNGNFSQGKGFGNNGSISTDFIQGNSETITTDFKIESLPNPGETAYVLKQQKFNNKGYNISIQVEPNKKYYLSFWKAYDDAYDGTIDNDIEIKSNGINLVIDKKIVKDTVKGNYKWFNHIYIITNGEHGNIDINLGSKDSFTKGHRIYADIYLRRYIKELPDFKFMKQLECMIIGNKQTDTGADTKTIKSLTGRHDIVFKNKITKGDLIDLNNNSAEISPSNTLMGEKFTVIIGYKANIIDRGILFKAHTTNKPNTGVEIELSNTQSQPGQEYNTLTIKAGTNKYIYNGDRAGKLSNICIVYDNTTKDLKLFIDGLRVHHRNKSTLVVDKPIGTCPDGWKLVEKTDTGTIKCENSSSTISPLVYDISTVNKTNLSTSNNLSWTNCNNIEINELALTGAPAEASCAQDTSLTFTSAPITINNDLSLTGSLKNILIYKRCLSDEEIIEIHKYLVNIYNGNNLSNIDAITNRPSIYNNTNKPSSDWDCPFKDESICKDPACQCIDWNNPVDIPEQCKIKVNNHCQNNFNDPKCNNLRKDKCKKQKEQPKCNDSKDVENLKTELKNMKQQVHSLKNTRYQNFKIT